MKRTEILKICGTGYTEMTRRILKAAQLAEEIRKKCVQTEHISDPLIMIKPNLVSPTPASFGATTHPEIVAGIIEYLQQNRISNIIICEGSWVGDKTSEAFKYCGYEALSEKYGVKLFDTQKDSSCKAVYKDLEFRICDCVRKADFLINVPVLKGHCQTKITCALKNMKGLIPNSEKRRFHSLGLHKPIAYLNRCISQDFIVIDNICGDPFFEDGGNPRIQNCIMAAKDPLVADIYACRVLGIDHNDVDYIRTALQEGEDPGLPDKLIITGLGEDTLRQKDAGQTRAPVELNYATEEIESCSACYSALTNALSQLDREGLLEDLTYIRHFKFCIGQGYKKTACTDKKRIGIGSCTRNFVRSIPGCPPEAEDIAAFLRNL